MAAGGREDGACVPDWATAGMVRQKLSNHAMDTVATRAFMGNSSPELFLIVLNPITPRLAGRPNRVALARARKLLSVKGRLLRSLYAETESSTHLIADFGRRLNPLPIPTRHVRQVARPSSLPKQ